MYIHQSKNHQSPITRKHFSIEQEVALGISGELCINTIPDMLMWLVKELDLSMEIQCTHQQRTMWTESEAEPLDQAQHSKNWSQVARCLFLSQDRADKAVHCERAVPEDVES